MVCRQTVLGCNTTGNETFVANPDNGSLHNRGCAVDLTLYVSKTETVVPMVADGGEFTERAYTDYPGGTSRQASVVATREMESRASRFMSSNRGTLITKCGISIQSRRKLFSELDNQGLIAAP